MRQFPFLLPLTAVTMAAFFGGTGPALLVAILSEPFLQYFVVGPERSFALPWPSGYIGMAFFLSLSAIIIALSHGMFGALRAFETAQSSLRRLNQKGATGRAIDAIIAAADGGATVSSFLRQCGLTVHPATKVVWPAERGSCYRKPMFAS